MINKFLIIILPFILFGCGYTVRSNFPPDIKTIHIETFANKIPITEESYDRYSYRTYRPLLEVDITNAVINRFIYYGSLKVVKEKDADLLLTGELKDFIRQPLRTTSAGNVEEFRLNLVVDITLKNTRKNEVMWIEEGLIGDTTYFASGTLAKSEAQAVDDAIKDLARRIADRVVEGW
jgi:hypothetical protein